MLVENVILLTNKNTNLVFNPAEMVDNLEKKSRGHLMKDVKFACSQLRLMKVIIIWSSDVSASIRKC